MVGEDAVEAAERATTPKKRRRPKIPTTPAGCWGELNRKYFEGRLPPAEEISFKWIADGAGEGASIRTSHELASTCKVEGKWLIELNDVLRASPRFLLLMLAHEAIHVLLGVNSNSPSHNSAAWNREVRRLNGVNLLAKLL